MDARLNTLPSDWIICLKRSNFWLFLCSVPHSEKIMWHRRGIFGTFARVAQTRTASGFERFLWWLRWWLRATFATLDFCNVARKKTAPGAKLRALYIYICHILRIYIYIESRPTFKICVAQTKVGIPLYSL